MPVCKAEAHRALELLEDYYSRLDDAEEKELKAAIERVIKIFKSRLFQALLDIQEFYELTLMDEGKTNEAKASEALERGKAAGFSSAQHYYSLGARLYRDERMEDASKAFAQALEVDPKFARAERSLGNVHEKLGNSEEAVVHFKRYLELAPNAPDAKRIADLIAKTEAG